MIEKYTVFRDSFQLEKNKILIIKETIKSQYEQKLQQNNNSSNSNLIKIIRQSQKWRGWNRCEVLGCNINNFTRFIF